jgi:hypothetical protein
VTATTTTKKGWSTHRGWIALAVGYQWFYNGADFLAFVREADFRRHRAGGCRADDRPEVDLRTALHPPFIKPRSSTEI